MPEQLSPFKGLQIRFARVADHPRILEVMPAWWGGRDLRGYVPLLFLEHFRDTSFVAESGESLAGFMIAFLSPAQPDTGYVHFLGVGPEFRKLGLASHFYGMFFEICRQQGRGKVKACTSPVNRDSIAFHRRLGFTLEQSRHQRDGVPIFRDYNRPGDEKVRFLKEL